MRAVVSLSCLALASCAFFATPLEVSSEHFHLVANTHTSSEPEMRGLLEQGEAFRAAIVTISPPDMRPDSTVEVVLHGTLRRQTPYVDELGTIHLWRFAAAEGGYSALFAHELTHAIDFDVALELGALDWPDLGFYSEGWAEYAALLVDPDKTGFSLYGFDEDVVVGHWIRQGGLTLAQLRSRHEELNKRCEVQGYILRASWFRWVDEVLGREVLQELVAARGEWTPASVEAVLGMSLDEADAAWRAWALARQAAHPDADAEAAAYRERTSWYTPCVE